MLLPGSIFLDKPLYIEASKHRYDKRAKWHDYSSKCHYMVTITRNEIVKFPFSQIVRNERVRDNINAVTVLTDEGRIIHKFIYGATLHFPNIEIKGCAIMPDHIHFVIYFRQKCDFYLWDVVNFIKSKSTGEISRNNPSLLPKKTSAFKKSFNDRIIIREGMLKREIAYVTDNPRRHLLRIMNKDFFTRHHIISNGEMSFIAFGNILLLKDPVRAPLIVSSRYSEEERVYWEREWENTARERGVFVSPFISPQEKKLRNEYLDMESKEIRIVAHGFWERFKPMGKDFDLCAEGRLLLISYFEDQSIRKVDMRRDLALSMNDLARKIASMPEDGWVIKKAGQH